MGKVRKSAAVVRMPEKAGPRVPSWLTPALIVALIALTVFVYAPVRNFDFVEIDDPAYVRENLHIAGGLTWAAVSWAFTSVHAAYWLPLTWISYMVDVEIFGGIDAGGHHITNLILHVVNTILLFGFLRRTTGAPGRSAFVAALFAIHPLHVESVAWITERKDVLSTFFWLVTMWAYLWYVQRPGWRRYAWIVAAITLGLMAKPMLVTLPFALLLLDVWPLNRIALAGATWSTWKVLVYEKLPLLVVTIAASIVAFVAQRGGGAASTLDALPMALRLQNAAVSYVRYLVMMVWPANLTVFYPYPPSYSPWVVAGAVAVLSIVTAAVVLLAKRAPYLAVGWFWYLGTLVPVIGIVQVGLQAVADRFTYVPLVGIFAMIAWGATAAAGSSRSARAGLALCAVAVVGASSLQARTQLGYWHDSVPLWTHAVEGALGLDNYQAHMALGRILNDQGRLGEALTHCEEAVRLRPASADAQHILGLVLVKLDRLDEAGMHLAEAIRARPDMAEARGSLGQVLARQGRIDEAIAEYSEALRLKPDVAEIHNNLGAALAGRGDFDQALEHFRAAVRLKPGFEMARMNIGAALLKSGRLAEALQVFQDVLQRNPQQATARRAVEQLSRH
jgi:protein O-mannosyl-transferase